MTDEMKPKRSKSPWIIAIIVILLLVIGWRLFLPLLGVGIALTAGVLGIVVGTIAALCVAILLFFIFSGAGVFVLGALAFVWALVAIILFPIIFPIVVPIMIILLLVSLFRRKNR